MRLRDHGSVLALEAGRHQRAGCDQGHAAGQAQAERRPADDRSLYQGVPGADRVHDPGAHSVARRTVGKVKLVTYESKEPSAFAEMLGGLIDANVQASPSKQKDFDTLTARVGIWVTDIDEGVTLVFESGRLTGYNGHEPEQLEDRGLRAARLLRRRRAGSCAQAAAGQAEDRRDDDQRRDPEPRDTDLLCSVIASSNPPTGAARHLPGERGGY